MLTSEGRNDALGDWLREDLPSPKFLALLTGDPGAEGLIATMPELPMMHGYNRQRVWSFEWQLSEDTNEATTLVKTFGLADGGRWEGITHVALLTAPAGSIGKLLGVTALGQSVNIAPGQAFKYTLTIAAS